MSVQVVAAGWGGPGGRGAEGRAVESVNMFGINGSEMIVLLVVVLVVIGPQRLPEYAQQLRDLVRALKRRADEAKESVKKDFGEDFEDVDWQKLDPRQYDPRRIVREALQEEETATRAARGGTTRAQAAGGATAATLVTPIQRYQEQASRRDATRPAPFDPDAT